MTTLTSSPDELRTVLKPKLVTAIKKVMQSDFDTVVFPWLDEDVEQRMAEAAVNVVVAMALHERYLADQGMFKE